MSDKREEKRKESEGDQKEKTNTNNSKESKEDTKEVFDKTDHCTLTLKNMKRPKEITDDTWADVLVECEKFGTVERVRLIIQDDDAEFQVDFKNAKDCFNACKNLDGRSYDSNKVVAQRINKVV